MKMLCNECSYNKLCKYKDTYIETFDKLLNTVVPTPFSVTLKCSYFTTNYDPSLTCVTTSLGYNVKGINEATNTSIDVSETETKSTHECSGFCGLCECFECSQPQATCADEE